ncbi:MAG TPA: phosphoribosylamine--glycine ligase [Spirochaetia bacterium]|nr:phosphoribosylamine--glycine ligase [Spirochaetia bacterium]
MKVLVLGSGAREHAITWKFSKSKRISGLFVAPGNAGTEELGENLPDLDMTNADAIVETCRAKKIDFVFVGSEQPLAAGVVDRLIAEGIHAFGPTKKAAELEASKAFSKKFMADHGIPTADYREFSNDEEFIGYMKSHTGRVVVKKSGLAAGKGVSDSEDRDELIEFGKKAVAHDRIIVEDYLAGYELSVFALTDGRSWVLLPVCADFKKAEEGDRGKNTGGMGAVCPVPAVDSELLKTIQRTIIEPTFSGMAQEGLSYKGVLYFGLINTEKGPRLLEYNVRFGDPEAQVLLPLVESDFANLMDAIIDEKLDQFPLRISDRSALAVVIASKGYPDSYRKGCRVDSLPSFPENDALLFHASTKNEHGGKIVTGGGRCFTVVGMGSNLLAANVRAYEAAERITFDGAWYRRDIGKKFFID